MTLLELRLFEHIPIFLKEIKGIKDAVKELTETVKEFKKPEEQMISIEKACEWVEKNFNMPDDFREHFIKAMKD